MTVLLVLTNLPDRDTALALAREVVQRRLGACANVLAPCTSVYRWQAKLEEAAEVPVLIKSTQAAFSALEAAIRELHPYELPEIVAVPLSLGSSDYLNWVVAETQPPSSS